MSAAVSPNWSAAAPSSPPQPTHASRLPRAACPPPVPHASSRSAAVPANSTAALVCANWQSQSAHLNGIASTVPQGCTWNLKAPSVTCVSTLTTRHTTLYVPAPSPAGKETIRR